MRRIQMATDLFSLVRNPPTFVREHWLTAAGFLSAVALFAIISTAGAAMKAAAADLDHRFPASMDYLPKHMVRPAVAVPRPEPSPFRMTHGEEDRLTARRTLLMKCASYYAIAAVSMGNVAEEEVVQYRDRAFKAFRASMELPSGRETWRHDSDAAFAAVKAEFDSSAAGHGAPLHDRYAEVCNKLTD